VRISTPEVDLDMCEELNATLGVLRRKRGFSTGWYVETKALLINRYFETYGLRSAVVALSGGVDSTLVAGLMAKAASAPGSVIKELIGVCLPVFDDMAATGQDMATRRGKLVAERYGFTAVSVDLTEVHEALCDKVEWSMQQKGEAWARGQAVAYVRTPALYYITSLLTEAGMPGVLCGTTNLDEGGYLGYFGKASDGMVDLQLISDIHKSEVYRCAEVLGAPREALEVTPAGDMFDGRSDVEVFGTSYDFVELFLEMRGLKIHEREEIQSAWSGETRAEYEELSARLERLHEFNGHKYLAASPAVHLDVMDSKIRGGWKYETWEKP
jgi:NAD+ synthase (glutamine-hydrolysing)